MQRLSVAIALAFGVFAASSASASSVTYSFTNGNRSATALFEDNGGNLVVTLTNTSTADAMQPIDLLTAVFFDVAGSPSLTTISADMCGTCQVLHPPATPNDPAPTGVGGEWAFRGNTPLVYGADYGISSTGLTLFSKFDVFPGLNLDPPDDPGGPSYGITTAGDNPATGNGGINVPIIQNQVIFRLGNFGGLSAYDVISNVTFQYGTALDEPHFGGRCTDCTTTQSVPTPEPATLLLLGSSLFGSGYAARRRRRAAQKQS